MFCVNLFSHLKKNKKQKTGVELIIVHRIVPCVRTYVRATPVSPLILFYLYSIWSLQDK